MQIEHLKEFVALYEELNFTRAASRLFIAQSVLSRHINNMEKELNVQLFIRDKHRVQATLRADYFYSRIKPILEQYNDTLLELTYGKKDEKQLRIAYLPEACNPFLRKACKAFSKKHPTAQYLLKAVDYNETFNGIEGDPNLLFSYKGRVFNEPDLYHEDIYDEYFCVCVNKNHPYAQKECIAIKDLQSVPFTLLNYEEDRPLSKEIAATFAANGITEFDNIIVPDSSSIPIMASPESTTDCIFMFSDLQALFDDPDLVFVPVKDDLVIHVTAIWQKKNDCTEIRDLISECKKVMESNK